MRYLATLTLAFIFSLGLFAQPRLQLVELAPTFPFPVDITGSGDGSGRLFVVDQRGLIRVYDQNTSTVQSTPFLDITNRTQRAGEQGLLGLTFDPDFAANGYFYVNYVRQVPRRQTVISRFTALPGTTQVNTNSELIILIVDQPADNHNAGDLAFGPDGMLYVPLGDSGGGGDPGDVSQDSGELLGKLLRLDVSASTTAQRYTIPADNPFLQPNDGIRDEIYAFGLRNPYRIAFDRANGNLWIADVGQNAREEVNRLNTATGGGQNFGWDCREGFANYTGTGRQAPECARNPVLTAPVYDYQHGPLNGRSITGGFVYRGKRARDLVGMYVAADFISGSFYLYPSTSSGNGDLMRIDVAQDLSVSTFGEDDNGNLYVADYGGKIYEVRSDQFLPAEIVSFTGAQQAKSIVLNWESATEDGVADYVIEKEIAGNFRAIGRVAAGNPEGATYELPDVQPDPGTNTYRLRTRDLDGRVSIDGLVTVNFTGRATEKLLLLPNPASESVRLQLPDAEASGNFDVVITDMVGKQTERNLPANNGMIDLRVADLPTGTYLVSVQLEGGLARARLVVSRQK